MKKTIGIIGGMGPMATCDLFQKILETADADSDQAYPRVVIDCNSEIPDRTEAILAGGADPVPEMVRSAVRLEGMGADVLVMACNTAHYFYDRVQSFVRIPILNMLEETARHLKERGIQKAALLATDGTVQSGVYGDAFERQGIELILPSDEGQKSVMDLIYNGVKKNDFTIPTDEFVGELDTLFERGAQTLVLGCTELPIAFSRFGFGDTFRDRTTDPTQVLAESALRFVGCGIRP